MIGLLIGRFQPFHLGHLDAVRFALSNVLEHKGDTNHIMKDWVKKHGYKVHKLNYDYKNSNYHSTAKNNKTIEVLITNY